MSQSHVLYCRLEIKLGENSFNLHAGIPGNFLEKRKVPATTEDTREGRITLERGCLLLVTMEKFLVFLESLQEHRLDTPALSSPPCAVELYPGQGIYSFPQI